MKYLAHYGPGGGHRAIAAVLSRCAGLVELKRQDSDKGRFTLIFLAAPGDEHAQVELTHNWDPETYDGGRNFGHLAYAVDDIYATCQR
jgi:lactoylglutathione lyase